MKQIFGDKIQVSIHTNDSPEALQQKINSAIRVFANGQDVPLKIAISNEKMEAYLRKIGTPDK